MEDNNLLLCVEGKWCMLAWVHMCEGVPMYVFESMRLSQRQPQMSFIRSFPPVFFERGSLWPKTYWFGWVICIICSMNLPASTFTVLGLQTCHHTQLIFNIGSGDWTEAACLATILRPSYLLRLIIDIYNTINLHLHKILLIYFRHDI